MIDFLLGYSLWYTSCLKLRGIITQKLDRATLKRHPFWADPPRRAHFRKYPPPHGEGG